MRAGRYGRWVGVALSAGFVALGALLLLIAALAFWAEHLRDAREVNTASALAPPRGRWIDTADARLFVQEWGPAAGPMLLLSHGTGAWSGTWFKLPDALAAAGWHVVATDLPPFGFSRTLAASPVADYTRAAQARRLLALIDALGGRDVTLVGHSFGAGPALEAALLGAGRLRQLVLVDPALGLGSAGEAPGCAATAGWAEALLDSPTLRGVLLGAIVTQPRFTPALLSQFVFRKEAVDGLHVPAYQQPFGQIGFSDALGDWAHSFARASCESAKSLDPKALAAWAQDGPPLTLLWGEQDTVTPLAQGRALQQWMPRAALVVIPQVGHIPHLEDPAAFTRALLDTIRQR